LRLTRNAAALAAALELIPNGGRPNNYLIATAKSNKKYGLTEIPRLVSPWNNCFKE
jgi:hypothetical protein